MIALGNARQGHTIKTGRFDWTIKDRFGRILDSGSFDNGMTTVGLTAAISAELCGGTQITTWYMGLVDNSGWTAFAAGDTMGSHGGWTELIAYNEAARRTLTFAAAAGGVAATSAPCTFTINDTVAIKGAFIVSNSTKSGSTGILRATGAFGNVQNLVAAQTFSVNYTATNSAA